MKKSIGICMIMSLMSLSVPLALAAEEQTLREELETHRSGTEVSHEKYRDELEKILNPRRWDADLRFVLFPLGAIALGVVIIFFIRQIRMNLISEAGDEVAETELDHVETERAALARAETAEAASDFRGALRFLYLSAILHLQERGVLPYDKSLTNREYLHQAQADIDLHTALGPAITVFDEVWYGYKPCDAETVASYRDLLEKVYARH
ncbi:DUF4129 domain-containing protein [Candidatus Poribacteria bacterium]|nr:DUF4129 domain-containing protein [Candidatus Poribacteria bacterium]MYH83956.1 DUF4129 domain-containing protein [Candidatus Poribacteria bacterium]MYK96648.1 DUF4129 domain-containing protein [Candidatus Poribacteria bacterium]